MLTYASQPLVRLRVLEYEDEYYYCADEQQHSLDTAAVDAIGVPFLCRYSFLLLNNTAIFPVSHSVAVRQLKGVDTLERWLQSTKECAMTVKIGMESALPNG